MDGVRRYPAIGGFAACPVPVLFGALAACAAVVADWDVAVALGVLGIALDGLQRAVVLEVSPRGLSRSFAFHGSPLGPSRVVAWSAVDEIVTRWRWPHDFTALETVVVGASGERISFGSVMGIDAYRGLVAEIARRAPEARRTGLTEALLAETRASR